MSDSVPDDQHGWILRELVRFPVGLEINLAPDGIPQVDLAVDHVGKRGRVGI